MTGASDGGAAMTGAAMTGASDGGATMKPAGIVLAGGRSRRFGRDKLAALMPDDRSMLGHAADALAAVCSDIVVVLAPDGGQVAFLSGSFPASVRLVRDPEPFGGPVIGLRTGLSALAADIVLVAGGDMPAMVGGVLQLLAERLADRPMLDAVLLEGPENVPLLPCALRREAAMRAAREALVSNDRRLRGLFERLEVGRLDAAEWRTLDPDGRTILDVDRPGDLASLSLGTRDR
jgi:molybdenum cofactor guanylyltransferase